MSSTDNYEYNALLESFRGAQKQYRAGNRDFAEPIFWGALSKLNESSSELAECLRDLAELTSNRGDYNEAIRLYLRLLTIRAAVEDNSSVAKAMEMIAELYEVTGRLTEAEYMTTRAHYLRNRLAGGEMPPPEPLDEASIESGNSLEGCLGSPPDWLKNAFVEAGRAYGPKKATAEQSLDDEYESAGNSSTKANSDTQWATGSLTEEGYSTGSNRIRRVSPLEDRSLPKIFARPQQEKKKEQSPYAFNPQSIPRPNAPNRPRTPSQKHEPAPGREQLAQTEKLQPLPSSRRVPPPAARDSQATTGSFSAPSPRSSAQPSASGQIINGIMVPGSVMRAAMRNVASFTAMSDAVAKKVGTQPQVMTGFVVVIAIYVVCFVGAMIAVPKKHAQAMTSVGDRYRSADGEKLFDLIDRETCEIHAGSDYARVKYKQYMGDIGSAFALALGAVSEKQYCLERQGFSLCDLDDTRLYLQNSSEMYVLGQLESLNTIEDAYYKKDGSYPASFSTDDIEKLTYKNPLYKNNDHPTVQRVLIDKTKSATEADYERTSIYQRLNSGDGWDGRPALNPYSLNCCSIVLKSPRGNINAFVCQPTDSQGHVYSGSLPRTKYFFALEDGRLHHPARPKLPFGNGLRQPVVWLIEPGLDNNSVDFLRHGCIYFFGIAAFLIFLSMNFIYLNKVTKSFMLLCSILSAAIAVIYVIAPFLP